MKGGLGVSGPLPKPYLWPKSAIFATLFMTWPKIWYPIYDRCGWSSCPKHKFWRAFVDGLIDNDKKVASSKEHIQFKARVLKPYPIEDQNGKNRYPIYDQNGWKPLPFGAAHTCVAYIREYPLPTPRASRLIFESRVRAVKSKAIRGKESGEEVPRKWAWLDLNIFISASPERSEISSVEKR